MKKKDSWKTDRRNWTIHWIQENQKNSRNPALCCFCLKYITV